MQCSLDGAPFSACTSPQAYSSLPDGPHTSKSGRPMKPATPTRPPPARSFTVDTQAPDTTISSGPSGPTNATSASFEFSSEPGASLQCSLDGAPFSACTSPQAYSSLPDGPHTFEVAGDR